MTKVDLAEKVNKKCARCNTAYMGTRASKYCSDECRKGGNNANRKARLVAIKQKAEDDIFKEPTPAQIDHGTPTVLETPAPTTNEVPPIETTVPQPTQPQVVHKDEPKSSKEFTGFFT